MTGTDWTLTLTGALVLGAFSWWVYRARELSIRGRTALAVLRAGTLVLVLLLLVDPALPSGVPAAEAMRRWVGVDASRSMAASAGGSTPWEKAVRRAGELSAGGADIVLFGEAVRPLDPDSLASAGPQVRGSRLAPLLERAAESGANEVVVLSDRRVEDPVAVAAALARHSLRVRFEDVAGPLPNAGVEGFRLEPAPEAGRAVEGELTLFRGGGMEDSVTVEVREEERLVLSERVKMAPEGRLTRLPLSLPAPGTSGDVRYTAHIQGEGDVFPEDDERVQYTTVGPDEGLLVLVSLQPDWEPRFLLPVMGQVTGLPVRGVVRVQPDLFLPLGDGAERAPPMDAATLRPLVRDAELLVVHGAGGDVPTWLAEAATQAGRLLLLPEHPGAVALAGLSAGASEGGEWYVAEELPPSPVAGELAGVPFQELPPLTRVLPLTGGEGRVAPLDVQLRGAGPEVPALALDAAEGRRRAVVLAGGFWRWAFRDGAPRDAYRRLWSAVAGWLLADEPLAGGPGVRPESRVLPAGGPVPWVASGLGGREVALHLTRGDSVVMDTTLAVPEGGGFRTAELAAGMYRYTSQVGEEVVEGRFDVESYSPELRHLPMPPPDRAVAAGGDPPGEDGPGRPLRTHPAPYVLLLGLLCGEWALRRRRGLR